MNRQVKAGISAVRDFLASRSSEAKVADTDDKATRQVVAEELLVAMSHGDVRQEQDRARQLFLDQGYFDEAVQKLRGGNSAAERIAAARALGLVGSQRATAHLIAAMFDDDLEVRSAAGEALAQIGDPTLPSTPLNAVVNEPDAEISNLADSLHAPETSAQLSEQDSRSPSKETHTLTKDEQAHARAIARDRSGRFVPASKVSEAAPAKIKVPEDVEHATGADEATLARATSKDHVAQDSEPHGENKAASATLTAQKGKDRRKRDAHAPIMVDDAAAAREVEQLLLEEHAVRETLEQLERQLLETAAVRKESENQARWRIERESKLRTDAAARRREEEEFRSQADEEAERRRSEESQAVAVEQTARAEAEAEAQRLAEEEARLRIEAARLRMAAEELVRNRVEIETARREAAEAARHAEAKRSRDVSEKRHQVELKRLHADEEKLRIALEEVGVRRAEVAAAQEEAQAEKEALRRANEELAVRRKEVEAAREKADKDAERLLQAQARMRAAEEAREKSEIERLAVEAEIYQRVETEQRLLEEARRRAQEEQVKLEDEARRQAEAEQQRLADLEVARKKAEMESKQRAEQEHQVLSQIDSLRIADAEARRRIAEAEARRRTTEDAYRLVAEKVQRVEAEAHASAAEEERILAKLEAERRNVANEAQARAEQEKRIKEEIEMFRRLEDEERPRIEELTLQRTAAEARFQEQRDRLVVDEEGEFKADEQLKVVEQYQRTTPQRVVGTVASSEPEDTVDEELSPIMSPGSEVLTELPEKSSTVAERAANPAVVSDVPPAIALYLNSVDPYKRAAAVAELARAHTKDAFALISDCFDDHSPHVRNAAARALRKLEPTRTVDLLNRALEGGSEERRRNIGAAIAASGLATEAIDNLVSENREETYNALSILFVMAKTGEVEPLVQAIEEHQNDEVSRAVVKLLTLSGQSDRAEAALKQRANGRQRQ